jgi:pimeloyl-ACP methyl ester carboxylesterase
MIDITIPNGELALAASVFGAPDFFSALTPPVLFLHGIGNARDTWTDSSRSTFAGTGTRRVPRAIIWRTT